MHALSRPLRLAAAALVVSLGLTAAALAATRLDAQAGNTLAIQGAAPMDCYLGISMYPAGSADPKTGKHMIRKVNRGDFNLVFSISPQYRGGTFEVALWKKQVPLVQCRTDGCQWCARNGFHMEGLLQYRKGSIAKR